MTAVLAPQNVFSVVPAGAPVSVYSEHAIFAVDMGGPDDCSIGLALDVSATIAPIVLLPGFVLPRRRALAITHAPTDIAVALAAACDWALSTRIQSGFANLRRIHVTTCIQERLDLHSAAFSTRINCDQRRAQTRAICE